MTHTLIDHPIVKTYISELREKTTSHSRYRYITNQLSMFLAVESTRHLATKDYQLKTPLEETTGQMLAKDVVVIPILRAGMGMLHAFTNIIEFAKVGFIGVKRDGETKQPVPYYQNLPEIRDQDVIVVDPMLATGGSCIYTLELIQKESPKSIVVASIVSAPEGLSALEASFPDVSVVTTAIDRELDENKYIRPGLGDFGDRLYAT